jgi:hypothetical protein
MGSDYSNAKIERWETINGIRVPKDGRGEYLNWEQVSEDGTEARRLTDPYGVLMYGIGGESRSEDGGDYTVWLDFAELPDGRIALDACWDSESGHGIDEFAYEVVSREEATAAAVAMCDNALDACFNNEVERGEDPYAFAREVAEHCGGTVPKGCEAPPWDELRVCDDDPENVTFELVFHNDHDSYVSEIYGVEEGEYPADAAWAVCRRFGWHKQRPGDDDTSVRRVDHEDPDPVRDGWIGSDGRP